LRKVKRNFPLFIWLVGLISATRRTLVRICLPVFQFIFHYLYVHCLCAEKHSFR
jgi:hypothetical protein